MTPGETITLDVGDAPWATPDRAAFSLDNKTWKHTSPGKRDGKRIVYQQKVDAENMLVRVGAAFYRGRCGVARQRNRSEEPLRHSV